MPRQKSWWNLKRSGHEFEVRYEGTPWEHAVAQILCNKERVWSLYFRDRNMTRFTITEVDPAWWEGLRDIADQAVRYHQSRPARQTKEEVHNGQEQNVQTPAE